MFEQIVFQIVAFSDYTTYAQRRVSVYSAIVYFVNHYRSLTDSYIAHVACAPTVYSEIACNFHLCICTCLCSFILESLSKVA